MEIVGIKQETTFAIVISESAVRALEVIGQFGAGTLQKLVATKLSEGEAQKHADGLAEIQKIGGAAREQLDRLQDARDVAAGKKFAVDR